MKKKQKYDAMAEYLKQDARLINLYCIIALILTTLGGMFTFMITDLKKENKNLRNQVNCLMQSHI